MVPHGPLCETDTPPIPNTEIKNSAEYLKVAIDPDNILQANERRIFEKINHEFSEAFLTQGKVYNGHSGPIKAVVNMGPVQPPQRKGKLPLYGRSRLVELQSRFDELESNGVFAKPEDIGINVEYLNPSFLVNKPGVPD